MSDSFDVVVVGAGLAGSACALTLARNGVRVCVCERGAWPGEKSLSGMILYGRPLADMIPAFWKVAPVERAITRRRFSVLSQDSEVALDLRFEEFNHEPHNYTFSVLRSRFDRWFARQAAEAGATVFTEALVEHLLWEGQKVAGVRLRGGRDLAASVVVSCEGTNAFLVEQAGLRDPYLPRKVAVGVKEVLALPREVLQERFGLEGNEGVAMEFFGQSVKGLVGSAFLYTNQDTLSVGLSCSVASLIQGGIPPAELLAQFKQHPSVRRWLRGGERVEYGAQMIPEGGYYGVPLLVRDGFLVCGSAAGFVGGMFYHEGSSMALLSGRLAAESILDARRKGKYTARILKSYVRRLKQSPIIKDLRAQRHLSAWCHENPRFFKEYPELAVELLRDYFTVSDNKSKAEIHRGVVRKLQARMGYLRGLRDFWRFRKVMFGR
ncbi:MAG: FAD-dependent oxidoreductase [Nitrospirae bacterium]|nr:MAG: FAD-dependent oxidoreductase [Nitrospirota bacterium]